MGKKRIAAKRKLKKPGRVIYVDDASSLRVGGTVRHHGKGFGVVKIRGNAVTVVSSDSKQFADLEMYLEFCKAWQETDELGALA